MMQTEGKGYGPRPVQSGIAAPGPVPFKDAIIVAGFCILVGIVGCDSGRHVRVHPIPDSLASARIGESLVRHIPTSSEKTSGVVLRGGSALQGMDALWRWGRLSGDPNEVLGVLRTGLVDGNRGIFLVDESYVTVRYLSIGRDSVVLIGTEGQGPGEFFGPTGVALAGSDTLYITDSNMRVHRFSRASGGWTFERSLVLPFVAYDICTLRGKVFVIGNSAATPNVIHEIGEDGEVIQSFGTFYHTDSPLLQEIFTGFGYIECLEHLGVVVAVAPQLPEIHAYSSVGNMLWVAIIDRWSSPPIVATPRGGFTLDVDAVDAIDVIVGLVALPNGLVSIQVESRQIADLRERQDRPVLRSYVLDPTTGDGIEVKPKMPRILAAGPSHVVTYIDTLFPEITLHRYDP